MFLSFGLELEIGIGIGLRLGSQTLILLSETLILLSETLIVIAMLNYRGATRVLMRIMIVVQDYLVYGGVWKLCTWMEMQM